MVVSPTRHLDGCPEVRLGDGRLDVREASFEGAIVEVIAAKSAAGAADDELVRTLHTAVDIGGTALLLGQSRSTVQSVAGEIDRLLAGAADATGKLPASVLAQLQPLVEQLGAFVTQHFDPERATSVQHQIAGVVKGASADQVRMLLTEILDENGPLVLMNGKVTSELRQFTGVLTDAVGTLNEVSGKIETNLRLADAEERSPAKGRPFQETVLAELQAIHGPLRDHVQYVGDQRGCLGGKAGDFIVTVNPEEAHGSELRIAVEAKTGRLSASKAQAELASALDNREARAAILVFDGRRDAPLGGRAYCPHPGGKFTVVLDAQEMDPLALEVAAREARRFVIASAVASPLLTTTWLEQQRIRLRDLMEEARLIKRGENDGRRALDRIGGGYADLRARIIEILDDIDNRLAGESADRDAQSA